MVTPANQLAAQREHTNCSKPHITLPASLMTPMQWVCNFRQPASSLSRGSQLRGIHHGHRALCITLCQPTFHLQQGTPTQCKLRSTRNAPDKRHAQQEVDDHLAHARTQA